jgi:hypothetical protein
VTHGGSVTGCDITFTPATMFFPSRDQRERFPSRFRETASCGRGFHEKAGPVNMFFSTYPQILVDDQREAPRAPLLSS